MGSPGHLWLKYDVANTTTTITTTTNSTTTNFVTNFFQDWNFSRLDECFVGVEMGGGPQPTFHHRYSSFSERNRTLGTKGR